MVWRSPGNAPRFSSERKAFNGVTLLRRGRGRGRGVPVIVVNTKIIMAMVGYGVTLPQEHFPLRLRAPKKNFGRPEGSDC